MNGKTNYEMVKEFNDVFGVEKTPKFVDEVFDNTKMVNLRMDLIREEMQELEDAVEQRDRKEVIDALSDILYVVYGMGDCLGINLDHSFGIVHKSNMSKIANTEQQAIETVEQYKQSGTYDSPAYRSIDVDGVKKYLIYNKSSNKVLKNKDYTKANFDDML